MKLKKVKSKIPGATEISPSCSAAVYRMGREEITHNAIWFHPQCTLDGIVYMCEYCVCGLGGGYSATEKSQSTKIYLNMNFPGGGGVFCNWKITKYQEMPKFQWGGGGILQLKSQSAKISDNFHFRGGGGYSEAHLVFCMGSVYVLHLLFIFKYYSLFH